VLSSNRVYNTSELGSYSSRSVEYPDGPRKTCDRTEVEAEGEVDEHWLSGSKT
jgi:hypothetical protein